MNFCYICFYSPKIDVKAVFETFDFGLYSLDADIIVSSDLYDPEVDSEF